MHNKFKYRSTIFKIILYLYVLKNYTDLHERQLMISIKLEGEEFILLQSLLKLAGVCDTGGEAKQAIIGGLVTVDGVVETRRGKKIKAGQIITFSNKKIKVEA